MNCREAETLIQQSLDQTLTPEERQRLEAHFQRCPVCRQAWAEYRQLTQATAAWMKQVLADDPGDVFTQRVMAQAATRATPVQGQNRLWPSLAWLTALIGLTAALTMYAWPGTLSFQGAGWQMPSGQTLMEVPLWLWQNLRALPQDALAALRSATVTSGVPRWILAALPGVLLLNGLLVARVLQGRREQIAR